MAADEWGSEPPWALGALMDALLDDRSNSPLPSWSTVKGDIAVALRKIEEGLDASFRVPLGRVFGTGFGPLAMPFSEPLLPPGEKPSLFNIEDGDEAGSRGESGRERQEELAEEALFAEFCRQWRRKDALRAAINDVAGEVYGCHHPELATVVREQLPRVKRALALVHHMLAATDQFEKYLHEMDDAEERRQAEIAFLCDAPFSAPPPAEAEDAFVRRPAAPPPPPSPAPPPAPPQARYPPLTIIDPSHQFTPTPGVPTIEGINLDQLHEAVTRMGGWRLTRVAVNEHMATKGQSSSHFVPIQPAEASAFFSPLVDSDDEAGPPSNYSTSRESSPVMMEDEMKVKEQILRTEIAAKYAASAKSPGATRSTARPREEPMEEERVLQLQREAFEREYGSEPRRGELETDEERGRRLHFTTLLESEEMKEVREKRNASITRNNKAATEKREAELAAAKAHQGRVQQRHEQLTAMIEESQRREKERKEAEVLEAALEKFRFEERCERDAEAAEELERTQLREQLEEDQRREQGRLKAEQMRKKAKEARERERIEQEQAAAEQERLRVEAEARRANAQREAEERERAARQVKQDRETRKAEERKRKQEAAALKREEEERARIKKEQDLAEIERKRQEEAERLEVLEREEKKLESERRQKQREEEKEQRRAEQQRQLALDREKKEKEREKAALSLEQKIEMEEQEAKRKLEALQKIVDSQLTPPETPPTGDKKPEKNAKKQPKQKTTLSRTSTVSSENSEATEEKEEEELKEEEEEGEKHEEVEEELAEVDTEKDDEEKRKKREEEAEERKKKRKEEEEKRRAEEEFRVAQKRQAKKSSPPAAKIEAKASEEREKREARQQAENGRGAPSPANNAQRNNNVRQNNKNGKTPPVIVESEQVETRERDWIGDVIKPAIRWFGFAVALIFLLLLFYIVLVAPSHTAHNEMFVTLGPSASVVSDDSADVPPALARTINLSARPQMECFAWLAEEGKGPLLCIPPPAPSVLATFHDDAIGSALDQEIADVDEFVSVLSRCPEIGHVTKINKAGRDVWWTGKALDIEKEKFDRAEGKIAYDMVTSKEVADCYRDLCVAADKLSPSSYSHIHKASSCSDLLKVSTRLIRIAHKGWGTAKLLKSASRHDWFNLHEAFDKDNVPRTYKAVEKKTVDKRSYEMEYEADIPLPLHPRKVSEKRDHENVKVRYYERMDANGSRLLGTSHFRTRPRRFNETIAESFLSMRQYVFRMQAEAQNRLEEFGLDLLQSQIGESCRLA